MTIQLVCLAIFVVCVHNASTATTVQLDELLKAVLPPVLVSNQYAPSGALAQSPVAQNTPDYYGYTIPNQPGMDKPSLNSADGSMANNGQTTAANPYTQAIYSHNWGANTSPAIPPSPSLHPAHQSSNPSVQGNDAPQNSIYFSNPSAYGGPQFSVNSLAPTAPTQGAPQSSSGPSMTAYGVQQNSNPWVYQQADPAYLSTPSTPSYGSGYQPNGAGLAEPAEKSSSLPYCPSACSDGYSPYGLSSYQGAAFNYDYSTGQYYQSPLSYVYLPLSYQNYQCDDSLPRNPHPTPPPNPPPTPAPKQNWYKPAILNSILKVEY